ncbi:CapA family protein [Peptoniphilus sp.]|uniref:CapA family protein n=1 Tax=Peptoniphilus sp. TaxID=1971214 RepID=UPI003993B1F1
MKKLMSGLLVVVLAALCLSYAYLYYQNHNEPQVLKTKEKENIEEVETEKKVEPIYVKLMATGDVMFHLPTYKNAFDKEKGEYDFTSFYEKVSEDLKGADFAFANLETTINPNRSFASYPMFNAPKEALKYLKEAGFKGMSTANNHCIDTGLEGIFTTIDELDANGFVHFGTRKTEDEKPPIVDLKGIKVGFISYSEIFNGMDGVIPADKKYVISPIDYEKIKSDIDYLKGSGADIIISMPHYGVEYKTEPTQLQQEVSKFMIDNGVDLVLGSHPHVLGRAGLWEAGGRNKFLIYSMGNSISNQRQPWMGTYDTEMGVLVEIDITKAEDTNFEVTLHPTYVARFREEGGFRYYVYKMTDLFEGGKYHGDIDEKERQKVHMLYERAKEIMGEKYVK